MRTWALVARLAVACLLTSAPRAIAADDATLFRLFLKGGGSLVSYGEFARLGDRVVFSMPTSIGPNPPLHLVDIAADRVDWDRTDRYAVSARAARYIETQAENDYIDLGNRVARVLTDVSQASDAATRLALIEQARRSLADWPQTHYNYRDADVRQLLTMLDEAIADLRTASDGRFALNLVAYSSPPPPVEPLLAAPTLVEAIEQTLAAARLVDSPAERVSLLATVVESIGRDTAFTLPNEWASATDALARTAIQRELQIDRTYQSLTGRMMRLADERARAADVRGVERVMTLIQAGDDALGRARPDAISALVAAVAEKLDAARRLQLARDRWALRAPVVARYRIAIRGALDLFAQLKPALEDIKSMSGSSPFALDSIERVVARMVAVASAIAPPDEMAAAHAVFLSAAHLAENAARIRREAILSESLERAWDASSAAAGALMLGARARRDMQTLFRRPQLR